MWIPFVFFLCALVQMTNPRRWKSRLIIYFEKLGPDHYWRPVEHFLSDFGVFLEIVEILAPPVATKIIFKNSQSKTYFPSPPSRVCRNMAYRPLKSFSNVKNSQKPTKIFSVIFPSSGLKIIFVGFWEFLTFEKLFSGL